jgi:hypothetical protein
MYRYRTGYNDASTGYRYVDKKKGSRNKVFPSNNYYSWSPLCRCNLPRVKTDAGQADLATFSDLP